MDGQYVNKVPWLTIYEPVIIFYLNDGTPILAFTTTEYALAQMPGYFIFLKREKTREQLRKE